ncbi:MAG: hypothetical protein ACM3OG_00190 [Actinomycetota bacterium]
MALSTDGLLARDEDYAAIRFSHDQTSSTSGIFIANTAPFPGSLRTAVSLALGSRFLSTFREADGTHRMNLRNP